MIARRAFITLLGGAAAWPLAARAQQVVPLVGLMFQASFFDHPLLMLGLLAAGTIGFAAVGTLFAKACD